MYKSKQRISMTALKTLLTEKNNADKVKSEAMPSYFTGTKTGHSLNRSEYRCKMIDSVNKHLPRDDLTPEKDLKPASVASRKRS